MVNKNIFFYFISICYEKKAFRKDLLFCILFPVLFFLKHEFHNEFHNHSNK